MKKLIFTFILATLCGISAFAYDFYYISNGQTLYFNITSSTSPYTAELVPRNSSSPYYSTYPTGDLTIPYSVPGSNGRTYTVTSIASYAFYRCDGLTSVTIPRSVTSIGIYAFDGCSSLASVYYQGTIAQWCGITFSSGGFGSNPLYSAHNLYINNHLVTDLVIPNEVTEIKPRAFYGATCLTSVTIPNSVTSIGGSVFHSCSGLTSVTIGNSVTSIGAGAFYNCSGLTTVNFNATNCTTMGSANDPVFSGCSSFTTLNIGENVTKIPQNAFRGCSSLTGTLIIPNSVTNIGSYAFYGCRSLTGTLIIPNSVTNIGSYAFYGCSNLLSVYCEKEIPATLAGNNFTAENDVLYVPSDLYSTYYENEDWRNAFSSIMSIGTKTISYTSSQPLVSGWIAQNTISEAINSYDEATGNGILYLLNNATTIGGGAGTNYSPFYNKATLTYVDLSNSGIETIGSSAFYGCSGLTSVTIPESVTSIGNYAFSRCSGLTSVTIPDSVTDIGRGAFQNCSGLVDMTIPFVGGRADATAPSDTTLFGYIFNYSTSSGTGTIFQQYNGGRIYAYIPSSLRSVTVIGGNLLQGAFMNCSMLTSATIGNSVTSIGKQAFEYCTGLTEVTISSTVTSIGEYAYHNCSGLTTVNFNATNCTTMGSTALPAFQGCSSFTTLNIGENVTQIPQNAFLSCANLTTLIIPNSVTSIGRYAFWNCSGLTDIYANPTTPPAIVATSNYSTFNNYTATLWVPCGSATAYGSAVGWRNFSDIRENLPYTLNVASADLTMGTASITQQDCIEGTAIIEAYPNDGYAFSQWNDGNTDNPRIVTVTSDATYTATFVALHTITVTSADETQGTASGSGDYAEGSQVEISATPAEHHHFTQWNDGNTDNPRTITVTSDSTFTASFAIDQHTVMVVSADTEMGTVSEGGTYDYGTEIQISATPAEGYGFATWNDGNTDNPRTVTVTEDITYTANFGAWRTITVLSADETMGTVSGGGVYVEGAQVEISAEAVEHYHFAQWNDGNTDNPRTITVAGDSTFTASFAIDRFTITVESADEAMGTVSESNSYDYGAEIQISATASNGYHFAQWSDGNTDNPRTITVTGDATYIATFAPNNYTIVVRSLNEDWGTVSEGGTFPYGTEIQISATPRENYAFVAWTDGNTDNPRTITVVADAEYTAAFTWSVGIDETAVSEIALFPNPATDILNITSSETISEIEIVNVMGQVVKRIEVNSDNAVCNVEDLTSGVYVVRIHTEGTVVSQRKFVKE
jgi:hypothetical protein